MKNITIRRLSERTGISTDTIRYYRNLGLLHPKQCENGYFEYTPADALIALYTRELRGNNLPLKAIQSSFQQMTLENYSETLGETERKLSAEQARIQLELERIRETQKYVDRGMLLLQEKKVEQYKGSDTWTLCSFGNDGFLDKSLACWTDNFPFSYVAITISLKELEQSSGPCRACAGCGALDRYVKQLRLPLGDHAILHPAGSYLRACVPLQNPLLIMPSDLSLLCEYAAAHSLRFTDCIGGRLLFIADIHRNPLYYFMIWAAVEEV